LATFKIGVSGAILFRFETPETATGTEIDELRCLGFVNGEAITGG
jgi:hypothetical protein